MRADVQIVHRDAHGVVATFRNVVLIAIHDAMTVELLAASVRANRALAQRYPKRVASLTTASMGIKFPNAAERAAASEAIAAVRDNVLCAAQHLSGDGFWASTARSVVTAIEMLRPDDRPRRTFGKLSEATLWMATRANEDVAWAQELEKIVDTLVSSNQVDASVAGSALEG